MSHNKQHEKWCLLKVFHKKNMISDSAQKHKDRIIGVLKVFPNIFMNIISNNMKIKVKPLVYI